MGVILRGILGGFSGRVANVVGSSWKGIAYMKSLPLSVANPQTAGQTAQRTKFSAVVLAGTFLLATIIKPMWDRFAQKMSGYNDFISKNIDAFTTSGVLIAASFRSSIGTLTGFDTLTIDADNSANSINLNFLDNSGTGSALATDTVSCAWYNVTQDYWNGGASTLTRADLSISFSDTVMATGDTLECYASLRRADGTLVSNSEHATVVVVA